MEKKFEVSEFALEAVRHFEFSGTLINVRPFGNGHINDTYLAEYDIFGRTYGKHCKCNGIFEEKN